jgi:GTP-binding protein HflX
VTREEAASAARWQEGRPVLVSARTGEGIDALLAAIDARLSAGDEIVAIVVPAGEGRLRHWLHENSEIIERTVDEDGATRYRVRIDRLKRERLDGQLRRAGLVVQDAGSGG